MVLSQGTFCVQHQNASWLWFCRANLKEEFPFPILSFHSLPVKRPYRCLPFHLFPAPNLSGPVIASLKTSLKFVLPSTVPIPVWTFLSSSKHFGESDSWIPPKSGHQLPGKPTMILEGSNFSITPVSVVGGCRCSESLMANDLINCV